MRTTQQIETRLKEAVANVLTDFLRVPTIFFDAPWPNARGHVDVLAVDRGGVGDLHIVQVFKNRRNAAAKLNRVLSIPAQFKWIAYYEESLDGPLDDALTTTEYARKLPLFAPRGMGRIGVIQVHREEDRHGELLAGEVAVRAERFPGAYYEQVEEFIKNHRADIVFR